MKYFWWSAAGLFCIGIPFFSFYDPYDLWNSVIAGLIGGCIYLAGLYISSFRIFASHSERFLVGVVVMLLIVSFSLLTNVHHETTALQRDRLRTIRTKLGSGVIVTDKIYETLLPVFQAYHRQAVQKQKSITAIFKERYGTAITDGSFNRYADSEMDAVTHLSILGDTAVHIICIDTVARGLKTDFKNSSGHFGKLEYRGTLTAKGVRYERTN
jgi:hypothetical protein